MKSKLRSVIYAIAAAVIWIAVWELAAHTMNLSFIFPHFTDTMAVFFTLPTEASFWQTVTSSIGRILLGFILGMLLGMVIAPLTHRFAFLKALISPAMTVIRSTPVASFIMVLWCIIGKDSVPTAIGVLMVMPIIWQGLSGGLDALDPSLNEVCDVFELSRRKKIKLFIFPTITRYLLPAAVTSSALAWKSGIAAEIIVYAKNSIGKQIHDAKNFFESETMFAWTIWVIIFSILIELVIKQIARRMKAI